MGRLQIQLPLPLVVSEPLLGGFYGISLLYCLILLLFAVCSDREDAQIYWLLWLGALLPVGLGIAALWA